MVKAVRSKSDKVSPNLAKSCVRCEFGYFIDSPPLSGECRKTPPRSFLDKDGRKGRYFPQVKHDDWCGSYKLCADQGKVERLLLALEPFQSREEKLELAEQYVSAGRAEKALEIYESVFENGKSDQDLAFKIAGHYFDLAKKQDDSKLRETAHQWRLAASELGHPEAPYWVGVTFAQLGERDRANEYLDISCERNFPKALEKRKDGGFTTSPPSSSE